MEWISVNERKPEQLQSVLVFEGHMKRGRMRETRVRVDFWCGGGFMETTTATHWMPLPDPPVMKQDEAKS
jgi:hypothetical protein